MKSKTYVFFTLAIITLCIALRLYKIGGPVADWHSFRQADTAAVARNFFKFGFDILHPRYDDLSNIQSGKDNPMGWRMVELPLYQATAALGKKYVGLFSIEIWLRLTTIVASAGTALVIILLYSEIYSEAAGLLAGFFYAVLPYSVFYGRAILPETFGVFWAMLSVYTVYRSAGVGSGKQPSDAHWAYVLLSVIFGAIALLVKPTTGFLLLPVPYLLYRRSGSPIRFIVQSVLFASVCILPLLAWRKWILQYPEGIPAYAWLFNEGGIRFKGAWFWWLFSQRLGELMLGNWGLVLFALGFLLPRSKKDGLISHLLGLGSLLYVAVFAAGNVRHDYYQVITVPFIAVMLALGTMRLFALPSVTRVREAAVFTVIMIFTVGFSWYTIRTYYWINHPEIVEAGMLADRILPQNAKVIAPYNGDTSFLYQTNRQGWPQGFEIDKKISMGATHFVTISPSDDDFQTKELAQKYTVLVRTEKYAIIDLTKPVIK